MRAKDAFAALSLGVLGASVAFTYLLKAGMEGILTSRSDFTCKITLSRPGLESLVLKVEPRGTEGLGFLLMDEKSYPYLPWQPLTQVNMDALIKYLRSRIRESGQL